MQRIIVDHTKCTGCKLCQYVCSHRKINSDGINPKISAIQVITLGLYKADVPVVCKQCKRPLCKEKCPVDAFYFENTTRTWNIDRDKCIGCGVCAEECPFGAIAVHSECFAPIKCDLCGGEPACVKHCVAGALIYDTETRIGEGPRLKNAKKTSGIKEDR